MGLLSHMVLHHSNTSGHMLLDCPFSMILAKGVYVPAILVTLLKFLPLLVVTTTVRLALILLVYQVFFLPNDPLWDGQQCPGAEAPCCTHPNMPWFIKTLGETTTEDIQLRLCIDQPSTDEETLQQLIELYVS